MDTILGLWWLWIILHAVSVSYFCSIEIPVNDRRCLALNIESGEGLESLTARLAITILVVEILSFLVFVCFLVGVSTIMGWRTYQG